MTPLLLLALAIQDKSSDQILREAETLIADARTLYESGKTKSVLGEVVDAGWKADEARAKFQAVQQISSGENQKKASAGVREANQLIKMVNDARVALRKPAAAPPADAAPSAPKAPAPPPPPPAEKKPPAGPVTDLLKLVSAEKDIVAGRWRVEPGKLLLLEKRAKGLPLPLVEIPYVPPAEYDLRVSFRHSGGGDIHLLLSKDGAPFAFELGSDSNSLFALRGIKEPPGDPATTRVSKGKCLEGARSYTALVEVRGDGIRAYLDELLIAYASVSGPKDLGAPMPLALRRPGILGLAGGNQAVVTAIELVEIRGKGRPAR